MIIRLCDWCFSWTGKELVLHPAMSSCGNDKLLPILMKYLLKKQQSGYLKLSYQTYFSEEKGATLEVVASLTRC